MAENKPSRRQCATAEVHHRLLENPEYQRRRARVERFARRSVPLSGVVDVDVVVHIVLSDPTSVTDVQVYSQIDVLNEDFHAANADIGGVPSVWIGLVGDAELRFRLAQTDPDGNATNGITRTKTSAPPFGTNDEVKFAASGGADAWDADRYLNFWVCQLRGGVLGYAQFPGGPAETDGVVILDSAFGRGGSAQSPFDLGRTATHELGHFFDLRHIWGDRVACLGDDLVADTPQHEGPNYNRPTFPQVTCNNTPDGEMFMNYMDYVDDVAMFMFTKLQVTRMRTALAGPRANLIQNLVTAKATAEAAAAPAFTWE
jgi:hypothetical protein